MFTVLPAIDLRDGNVVRLLKGDYDYQTRYDVAPEDLAANYAKAGARWLHVVDLDGARSGNQSNLSVIEKLAGSGVKVQAGGGVRSEKGVKMLFDAGVSRVVVGSLAVREPDTVCRWLETFGPDSITLALDVRWYGDTWQLATSGWTRPEDMSLATLATRYRQVGAKHVLCTDIARDGTLSGPNMALYAYWHEHFPEFLMQASGGVRDMDDVRAVRDSRVSGVVLGRSLLEGHLELSDALATQRD